MMGTKEDIAGYRPPRKVVAPATCWYTDGIFHDGMH